MRFTSLPLKVALAGSLLLAVVFAAGTVFLTRRIDAAFAAQAATIQSETLSEAAHEVRGRLGAAAKVAESIGVAATAMRVSGIQDRAVYDAVLRDLLRANPDVLATWTGWEPNALDGRDGAFAGTDSSDASGRFLPYWNRGGGAIKREVLTGYETEADGAYYLLPKRQKRLVAIEPYIYPVAGKDVLIMSFGAPMAADEQYLGTAGVDIDLGALNAQLGAVKPFGAGYLALVSASGISVAHPSAGAAGKPISTIDASAADVAKQVIAAGANRMVDAPGPDGATWRYMAQPIQAGNAQDRWAIVVGVPVKVLTAGADQARALLVGISLLCVLIGCAVQFGVLSRLVGRPIRSLGAAIADMAAGNYDASVPEASRRDEVGLVGQAVLKLRDGLRAQADAEVRDKAAAQAAYDQERRNSMIALAGAFEEAVGNIVGTVTAAANALQATAQGLAGSAAQGAGQASAAASGAAEAALHVGAAASAAEELGASVQEIGRQIQGSAQLAQAAVAEVAQTVRLVQDLSTAVAEIGAVVTLISDIAGQTNLLALNATIEAARTGEAGRGFAVVAAEVKELAGQTARATAEISDQIARIQGSTHQAASAIGSVSERIAEINGVAATIAAAVEEQGTATQEIVRSVAQAAAGSGEVTTNIASVADIAETTGTAADHVLTSASQLSRESEHLEVEVNRFLGTVRAA